MTDNLGEHGVCPMTIPNCEKYHVTIAMQNRFCADGCSPICSQLFFEQFGNGGVTDE